MEGGRRNRVEALLGVGLGVGGLLLVGALLLNARLKASAPRGVLGPTEPVLELWAAHQLARAEVCAEDARLVSASTQWSEASEGRLLAGNGRWMFSFYSPVNRQQSHVLVGADLEARVVNQQGVATEPRALSGSRWQSGPQDALLAFLAYGGREFLEAHEKVTVDLHLGESEGQGPVWTVSALDGNGSGSLAVRVGAETQEILSVAP